MKQDLDFHYDVFISYSHQDERWVREYLLPQLESNNITVCIDYQDFELGAPSISEMERSIQNSRKTLVIISSNYIESEWTEFESIMAQTLDPAARKRRVIPLLLENVELPLSIRVKITSVF